MVFDTERLPRCYLAVLPRIQTNTSEPLPNRFCWVMPEGRTRFLRLGVQPDDARNIESSNSLPCFFPRERHGLYGVERESADFRNAGCFG